MLTYYDTLSYFGENCNVDDMNGCSRPPVYSASGTESETWRWNGMQRETSISCHLLIHEKRLALSVCDKQNYEIIDAFRYCN